MKITREIKRKIIQIAAFGYSNPYLANFAEGRIYGGEWKKFCNPGMNCYSCPAAGMACPIGAMQAAANTQGYRLGLYAMGLVLAAGTLLGRAICGFLCPFGLLQELLHRIPSRKFHIPKWTTYIKYILLAVFVLLLPAIAAGETGIRAPAFCKYICPVGTLEGGIPILSTHPELRATIGWLFGLKGMILIITLAGSVLVPRFFCKVLCPLGAIYGMLNKVSIFRMHYNKPSCISCGRCSSVCPMDVDPTRMPNSAECIRCGLCVTSCPADALRLGFTNHKQTAKEKTI